MLGFTPGFFAQFDCTPESAHHMARCRDLAFDNLLRSDEIVCIMPLLHAMMEVQMRFMVDLVSRT